MGENIVTIEEAAFRNCQKFTGNLIIPDKVETIGSEAFYYCVGFKGYLSIGLSVTYIDAKAFCRLREGYDRNEVWPLYFSRIYCKALTPPELYYYNSRTNTNYNFDPFGNYFDTYNDRYPDYLGVSVEAVSAYTAKGSGWNHFDVIEGVEF